jgi:hypothetical protein
MRPLQSLLDFEMTGPEALADFQFSAAKMWGIHPSLGGMLGVMVEGRGVQSPNKKSTVLGKW